MELASEFNGSAIMMEEMVNRLPSVDIVISSTGSRDYVLAHKHVQGLMRKRKTGPCFSSILPLPRDIDPRINEDAEHVRV